MVVKSSRRGATMPAYRVYCLDGAGKSGPPNGSRRRMIPRRSMARRFDEPVRCEVWHGQRLVGRVEPHTISETELLRLPRSCPAASSPLPSPRAAIRGSASPSAPSAARAEGEPIGPAARRSVRERHREPAATSPCHRNGVSRAKPCPAMAACPSFAWLSRRTPGPSKRLLVRGDAIVAEPLLPPVVARIDQMRIGHSRPARACGRACAPPRQCIPGSPSA